MKKMIFLAFFMLVILACSIAGPTTAPTATATNNGMAATQTQDQMATFVAQTVEAQQSATAIPTEIPPTVQATPFPLASTQWNGTFLWFGSVNSVSFVIQEVNGSSFTGTMFWTFPQCRVTERVEGDVIQDITTATEQNRWALHPDFQNGDTNGTWLRWTQNENIGGRCYLTISGDWWYAHITSNEHMIGIHFTNSTNTEPDKGAVFDFTLQ